MERDEEGGCEEVKVRGNRGRERETHTRKGMERKLSWRGGEKQRSKESEKKCWKEEGKNDTRR